MIGLRGHVLRTAGFAGLVRLWRQRPHRWVDCKQLRPLSEVFRFPLADVLCTTSCQCDRYEAAMGSAGLKSYCLKHGLSVERTKILQQFVVRSISKERFAVSDAAHDKQVDDLRAWQA